MTSDPSTVSLQKADWIRLINAATQHPTDVLSVFRERLTEDPKVVLIDHMTSAPQAEIDQQIVPAIREVVENSQPDNRPALTTALYLASDFEQALSNQALLRIAFGNFPTNNRRQSVALLNLNDTAFTDSVLQQLRERNDRQIAEVFWRSWSRTSPELAQRVDRIFGFSTAAPVPAVDPSETGRSQIRPNLPASPRTGPARVIRARQLTSASATQMPLTPATVVIDPPATAKEATLVIQPNGDLLVASYPAGIYSEADFPVSLVLIEAIHGDETSRQVVAHRLMAIQPSPSSQQPERFFGQLSCTNWRNAPENALPRPFNGVFEASLVGDDVTEFRGRILASELDRFAASLPNNPERKRQLDWLRSQLVLAAN
jgi:hypothetical protein